MTFTHEICLYDLFQLLLPMKNTFFSLFHDFTCKKSVFITVFNNGYIFITFVLVCISYVGRLQ